MLELGLRTHVSGAENLEPVEFTRDSPFPILPKGRYLVCGYDQGAGERLAVCDTLEDVTYLYEHLDNGGAVSINWYAGSDETSTIT